MFQKIKLNSLVGFIVITALSLSCDDMPLEIPVADTTPPQAVIIFPIDGEPVSGDIRIQVRATDNESVDSVRFFINQTWVGSDSTGEDDIFEFIWKTNNFVEITAGNRFWFYWYHPHDPTRLSFRLSYVLNFLYF